MIGDEYFVGGAASASAAFLAPPPPRIVPPADVAALQRLTSFTIAELDALHAVFVTRAERGLVPHHAFWELTQCPVLQWNIDSELNRRMFSLFDGLQQGGLNFFSFALGVGVLVRVSLF